MVPRIAAAQPMPSVTQPDINFNSKRNINLMLDGEKIATVVDEHRERTARNLGAHDYYQESAY